MEIHRPLRKAFGASEVSLEHGPNSSSDAQTLSLAYVVRNRNAVRSEVLMEAVRSLDATQDSTDVARVVAELEEQYAERRGGELAGILAKCYLGAPYIDHRLGIGQGILEHFAPSDTLPPLFEAARPLAKSQAYLFIEIYTDGAMVPVRADGTAVT